MNLNLCVMIGKNKLHVSIRLNRIHIVLYKTNMWNLL